MHISIKKKILLISISFSLIMGLVVALTSYSIFYHYNKNNLTHDTELNVSHITDTINEDFAPVASLVRWCQINARLLPYQLYKDNSGDSRTLLHERLNDQYNMVTHSNSNNHIQRLVVSNFSDYYIQIVSASYSTTADVPAVIMSQDYFHAALVSNDLDLSMGFVDDPLVRSSKQVLPIIRPIYHPYNNTILGWAYALCHTPAGSAGLLYHTEHSVRQLIHAVQLLYLSDWDHRRAHRTGGTWLHPLLKPSRQLPDRAHFRAHEKDLRRRLQFRSRH